MTYFYCGLVVSYSIYTVGACRVAFHPSDPSQLASGSMDGTTMVYRLDGTLVRSMKHSSGVSGVAWSVLRPNMLATTSEQGAVFVWDMTLPASDSLQRTLMGHE